MLFFMTITECMVYSITIPEMVFVNKCLLPTIIKVVVWHKLVYLFFTFASSWICVLITRFYWDIWDDTIFSKPVTWDTNLTLVFKAKWIGVELYDMFSHELHKLFLFANLQFKIIRKFIFHSICHRVYISTDVWVIEPFNLFIRSPNHKVERIIIIT